MWEPEEKLRLIRKLGIEKILPSRVLIPLYYEINMRKKINIKNPQTFNEKLQWLKMNYKNPKMTEMVDKVLVRDYISNILGEQYMIPLLGVYEKFDDIDFSGLPDKFVLKCNHDSGSYVICKDKKTFDIEAAKTKINKHLQDNYYYYWREWPYKNVKPKIMVEEYMEDLEGCFDDYKFFCFNGNADFVMVCTDRQTGQVKRWFYDKEWKKRNYYRAESPENGSGELPKPAFADEMFKIAEKLSKGFPHIRVDLYYAKGKIYFGELTFYHYAGTDVNLTEEADLELGAKIDLKKF